MRFIKVIPLFLVLALAVHNVSLYNPKMGIDASGHLNYIQYLLEHLSLPPANAGWELNQPPVFYLLASVFRLLNINIQVINIIALLLLIFGIFKLTKSWFAVSALVSLPMTYYLTPLVTNEYLAGVFGSLVLLTCLYQLKHPSSKKLSTLWVVLFALGFYTKVSNLLLAPIILLTQFFINRKNNPTLKVARTLLVLILTVSPLLISNQINYGKPLLANDDFFEMKGHIEKRDLSFFLSPSWVVNTDIFDAHDYSFVGGLWNTFWHDGEHIASPVVEFHKKPLVLWLLGFPLLTLSIYGLTKFRKKNKDEFALLFAYVVLAIASLIAYNLRLPYNSVLKAFFVFPVVIPYVIGLLEASKNQKLLLLSSLLISAQLFIGFSWFYIKTWWHLALP